MELQPETTGVFKLTPCIVLCENVSLKRLNTRHATDRNTQKTAFSKNYTHDDVNLVLKGCSFQKISAPAHLSK